MNIRTLTFGASLLLTAHAAHAVTRCDAIPNVPVIAPTTVPASTYAAQCNAAGVPVRSGTPVPGGVLQFVDQWQGVCELAVNGRGTGQFRADTICPLGATKTSQGGVWMCSEPARTVMAPVPGSNQRDACLQALRIRIDSIRPAMAASAGPNPPGTPPMQIMAAPPNQQGTSHAVLHGPDVGAADSVTVTSDAQRNTARRNLALSAVLMPYTNDQCLPPNCRFIQISLPPSTVTGFYTVTLTPQPPAQPGSTIVQIVPFVAPEMNRSPVMRLETKSCEVGKSC